MRQRARVNLEPGFAPMSDETAHEVSESQGLLAAEITDHGIRLLDTFASETQVVSGGGVATEPVDKMGEA